MNHITKKQHYVQQSTIISNWSHNGRVGIIGKTGQYTFRKENRKSPKSVLYQVYGYELYTNFKNINNLATKQFTVKSDKNHSFNINDAEKFCKKIEDGATPILKRVINDLTEETILKPYCKIKINYNEWGIVSEYIALQIIRTPKGRLDYFGHNDYIQITESTPLEYVDMVFRENLIYLMQMGVYDDTGIKDGRELPPSYLRVLSNLIKKSKPNFYFINNFEKKQFILGDNPCIIIGERWIEKILMPLTPRLLMEIEYDGEVFWDEYIYIYRRTATIEKVDFEICAEFLGATSKILYDYNICNYNDLQSDIVKAIKKYERKCNLLSFDLFKKSLIHEDANL